MSNNNSKYLATVETPPETINTVILLPDGRVAVKKPLSAKTFFDYQGKLLKQSSAEADAWLYIQSYEIDGEPLTRDDVDSLGFDDRARLDTEATNIDNSAMPNDGRSLEESNDFTLGDGRRVTRKNLGGDKYTTFKRKAAENSAEAFKWVIQQMFLIDGVAIDAEAIAAPPPQGLGFDAAAVLTNRVAQLFKAPPAPRTSSQSARLPAGD